jgi:hypothetical protein
LSTLSRVTLVTLVTVVTLDTLDTLTSVTAFIIPPGNVGLRIAAQAYAQPARRPTRKMHMQRYE